MPAILPEEPPRCDAGFRVDRVPSDVPVSSCSRTPSSTEDAHQELCDDTRKGQVVNNRRIIHRIRQRDDQSASGGRRNRPGIVFRWYRTVAIGRQRDDQVAFDHPVRARIVRFGLRARDSIPGASTTGPRFFRGLVVLWVVSCTGCAGSKPHEVFRGSLAAPPRRFDAGITGHVGTPLARPISSLLLRLLSRRRLAQAAVALAATAGSRSAWRARVDASTTSSSSGCGGRSSSRRSTFVSTTA